MALDYQTFLARSVANITAVGGRLMLPDDGLMSRPAWTAGWDQILLLQSPGTATLYALTCADAQDGNVLRERLDRLAAGLSASGMFSGPPVSVIALAAYPRGIEGRQARGVTGLTPSTYYPGMRPATWAVDLHGERVYTPGLLRRPEGRDLVERAMSGGPSVDALDADRVRKLQEMHAQRTSAFYGLMQARQPVVTYFLIALNVAIYALLSANGGPDNENALRSFGASSPRLIEQGEWWRLVTSMFLHASIPHILFNMTSLFAVGSLAERLYGSAKYLAIYLGAGLIGSLVSFGYSVLSGNLDILGVGASGAIFGVAGALVTVRFQRSEVIPQTLRDRVSSSMVPLVLISLVFSYLTPHVDNFAHLGGLFGGMALSFLFPLTKEVSAVR